jgi:hypothetical protein
MGPVGEVDILLHPGCVEIPIREGIERVAGQPPLHEPRRESANPVGCREEFIDNWPGQPEPRRNRSAESVADRDGVTVEASLDLGD